MWKKYNNIKIQFVLLLLLVNYVNFSYSQKQICVKDSITSYTNLQNYVYTLSNDSLGGRPTGTIYSERTKNYLFDNISAFIIEKYTIKIDTFEYQTKNQNSKTGHNLYALPIEKNQNIFLILAHYDHISPLSPYSNEILPHKKEKIHPGADDNASGVAMALELFRLLLNVDNSLDIKPALILFSGHEDGLYGSKHWTSNHLKQINISFVLNIDMVGRMDTVTNEAFIRYANNDSLLHILFKTNKNTTNKLNLSFRKDKKNIIFSDAGCFYQRKIPAYTISTGSHEDYHRITDTPEKLNYSGMYQILMFLYENINQNTKIIEKSVQLKNQANKQKACP